MLHTFHVFMKKHPNNSTEFQLVWTDKNNYANRVNWHKNLCEPVRTGVKIYKNRYEPKTYVYECDLLEIDLEIFVNRCEPTENIMWTGVNRNGKLCEPVRTVVRTNWKSAIAANGRQFMPMAAIGVPVTMDYCLFLILWPMQLLSNW